jgi:hypothetical protein
MVSQPGWDVWVITRHRDKDTISRFLDRFVDRAAAEDRGDEELTLDRLDRSPVDFAMTSSTTTEDIVQWFKETWDWEPAITLTHSIGRGLSRPWRAFSLYALPSSRRDLLGASIQFTPDDDLVLGVEARTRNEAAAWLDRLAKEFDADLGLVSDSSPRSRDGAEELIASGKAHLHWRRQSGSDAETSSRPLLS